jgi:hypothetical protein
MRQITSQVGFYHIEVIGLQEQQPGSAMRDFSDEGRTLTVNVYFGYSSLVQLK